MRGRLLLKLDALLRQGRALREQAGRLGRSHTHEVTPRDAAHNDGLYRRLLSGRGEASGVALAHEIGVQYARMTAAERTDFFLTLAREYSPDWKQVEAAFVENAKARTRASFQKMVRAIEPPRQELFRRINLAPGGMATILQMRTDLLTMIDTHPDLGFVDDDLTHLLRSWFNRGFLVMEQVGWSTPADLLERLIRYEAVHKIGDWDELRRRLLPTDRRCYAFFHPALASDPLIFVEIALTRTIPDSIQDILASERRILPAEDATTAVFYSISNCQPGLQGITFGNFLIKQVVQDLLRELPGLSTFVTLSPIPGFGPWLASTYPRDSVVMPLPKGTAMPAGEARAAITETLLSRAAEYLLDIKDRRGRPQDPVARFHLGNGARLERLCPAADVSPKGLTGSAGVMANYLYDLHQLEANHEAYASTGRIVAGDAVLGLRALVRPVSREISNVR